MTRYFSFGLFQIRIYNGIAVIDSYDSPKHIIVSLIYK